MLTASCVNYDSTVRGADLHLWLITRAAYHQSTEISRKLKTIHWVLQKGTDPRSQYCVVNKSLMV